ncbi:hypothetical protein CR194_03265 [Salipaludibacillus keqinensis]|uniref:DUF2777 domain-containing protein n=1 Tax=Salipaludibacillus keqinensis TaxID=2045207 RepID=A0A323TLE0_9BACI|nr:DUF2777 family protein [Salipaludibacillus keqinensis]PYZ94567.1 hypothetical protein CR194_03265 [Salipaludibacillus keqinensis]
MNRNKANQLIGHQVVIDEAADGQYVAILEEIITQPNTPWRGIVRIIGVLSYPAYVLDPNREHSILYNENQKLETAGKNIKEIQEPMNKSFKESLAFSLKTKWDEVRDMNERYDKTLAAIQHELRKLNSEHLIFEDAYVYYQLVKKGRKLFIYDEQKKESLSLEGCPFEFEVNVKGEWRSSFYVKNFLFETNQKEQVELDHGSTVRLNKAQFDPYRILMNELDEPSLIALERGLKKLGIGHEHSVYCHNSLLIQLLSSFNHKTFSGVNFISYSNDKNQFVVQHHYERTILEDEPDITFDRFEFTSDLGERVLTTYATQFTND